MELINAASSPETQMNGNFQTLEWAQVYGRRVPVTTGLTWGYYGGAFWGGFPVVDGTLTLANAATNHIVVARSTGAISVSSAATNWDDTAAYARVYKVTTAGGVVSAVEDHRAGPGGIFAGVGASGGGASGLLTGLVSYWKMDEASGNALDSHGTNHLTDTNTVGTGAGKVGSARLFVQASSEYFVKTPGGSDLTTGDIDFTISCWMYKTAPSGNITVVSKWQDSGSEFEYRLWNDSQSSGSYFFQVHGGGSTGTVATGLVLHGVWAHIICWHDSVNNQLGIVLDNGTPTITAWSAGVTARPTNSFWIGTRGNSTEFWNGQIDEVGIWKRMLTPAERTTLYNAGAGKTYPFT